MNKLYLKSATAIIKINIDESIIQDIVDSAFLYSYIPSIEVLEEINEEIVDANIYVEKGCENKIEIDLLEVCPQYTHKNKQRDIKYIGQALINFLIELAKEENKEEITVPTVYEDAIDFYERCGFSFIFTQEENAKLTSDKFDNALEQNRNNLNNNKKFFV